MSSSGSNASGRPANARMDEITEQELRSLYMALQHADPQSILWIAGASGSPEQWVAFLKERLATTSARFGAGSSETLTAWVVRFAAEEQVGFEEALDALRPVLAATVKARRRALGSLDEFVRVLAPSLADIDPLPKAVMGQARRRAALQAELMSQGAYSYPTLAEMRRASAAATRQFVRRAVQRHLLFTVVYDGETLVPAFLLDEDFEPKSELTPAISALRHAGEDGFALWAWFATPSAWLSGAVPSELAKTDPKRVAEAAQRRASNAA